MADAVPYEPVLFFCGILYADTELRDMALVLVGNELGETGRFFGPIDFNFTDYYEREIGQGIKREIFAFETLADPSFLKAMKLETNGIEKRISSQSGLKRPVNLDPGYLDRFKVVLASCKDGPMRIALGDGVFGEVTLIYRKGEWEPHRLTYADYRAESVRQYLQELRREYLLLRRRYL